MLFILKPKNMKYHFFKKIKIENKNKPMTKKNKNVCEMCDKERDVCMYVYMYTNVIIRRNSDIMNIHIQYFCLR